MSINLNELAKSVRLIPAFVSTGLVVLLLLFIRTLSEDVKLFFVPSLVVYSVGATLIGTFHRTLGYRFQRPETERNNDQSIPAGWMITILIIHFVLFIAFIVYNFLRGSL